MKTTKNGRRKTRSPADSLDTRLQRPAGAEIVPDTSLVSAYVTKSSSLNASAVLVSLSAKDMAQFTGDWGKITFPVLAASGAPLPPANQEHVFDEHVKNRQAWELPEPQDVRHLNDQADFLAALSSFKIYGREPACTAAYSSFIATEPMTLSTSTTFSYSVLGNGHRTLMASNIIQNVSAGAHGFCCGGAGALPAAPGCVVNANKLQLLYWPPSHPNTACLGTTAASFINSKTGSAQITSAPHSNLSVYAIGPDGYKYESPSVYVIYPSLVASDRCGSVGPSRTSITLAFEPGELSTVIYNATASGSFTTLALNINDLPCDPFRSSPALVPRSAFSQFEAGDHVIWQPSISSPFLALPSKIIDLVPAWSNCEMDPHGGYDPPRALSPATAMNPVHTVVHLKPQSNAAIPSPLIPSLPVETGTTLPQPYPHSPDQGFSPIEQSPPEAGSPSDAKDSTQASPPTNPERTPGDVFPNVHQDYSPVVVRLTTNSPSVLNPNKRSSSAQTFVGGRSQGGDSEGVEHINSLTINSWNPGLTQQGNSRDPFATWSKESQSIQKEGSIDPHATWSKVSESIPTANSKDSHATWSKIPESIPKEEPKDPQATWSKVPVSIPKANAKDPHATWFGGPDLTRAGTTEDSRLKGIENPRFTEDGTVLSALATGHTKPNPPAIAIQGQTITNNAAPITIGGAKVAYQSGILSVDSKIQPVPLSTEKGQKHTSLVIVGDLSFSILPAAAQSDFTHPVENAPGAASLLDKNKIPPDSHLDSFTYITVGGQTFTLQSNAIQVAGKTLNPGDPAITVDGTPISLGVSDFIVGTRTEILALSTVSATPENVITVDDKIIPPKGSTIDVAGITIKVGEPAATIDGTPISLGPSVLVIGSQTRSFTYPTDSMGTDNSGNLDAMVVPGLGGIGGGVVDAPSPLNTGTVGNSSVKGNTPHQGQAVILCVSVRMCLAWAIAILTVFLIWS